MIEEKMVPNTLKVGDRTYRIDIDRTSDGWFGVVFPNAAGCVAMGPTLEATLRYARANLADWIVDGGKPDEGPVWRRQVEPMWEIVPEFRSRIFTPVIPA